MQLCRFFQTCFEFKQINVYLNVNNVCTKSTIVPVLTHKKIEKICLFFVSFSSVISGGKNNVGWGVNIVIVDGKFSLK